MLQILGIWVSLIWVVTQPLQQPRYEWVVKEGFSGFDSAYLMVIVQHSCFGSFIVERVYFFRLEFSLGVVPKN